MITIISKTFENTTLEGELIRGQGILNFIAEEKWDIIYHKYKSYIDDKIKRGIFVISDKRQYAVDKAKDSEEIKLDVNKKIEEIVDKTIQEEAPQLMEAHKENKKAKRKNDKNKL